LAGGTAEKLFLCPDIFTENGKQEYVPLPVISYPDTSIQVYVMQSEQAIHRTITDHLRVVVSKLQADASPLSGSVTVDIYRRCIAGTYPTSRNLPQVKILMHGTRVGGITFAEHD
jgi:hypothetical protein